MFVNHLNEIWIQINTINTNTIELTVKTSCCQVWTYFLLIQICKKLHKLHLKFKLKVIKAEEETLTKTYGGLAVKCKGLQNSITGSYRLDDIKILNFPSTNKRYGIYQYKF